ncbi:DUF2716 domain-containing protein [Streptomyces sp. SID13666]|uniref:DUF2716 domain-containing protein n=1 Tax=unclassified Streptomyces TaxID=2593676 RepID=UPI0013C263A7|nr:MULTISPECIES: DUF2716 domain-containing protein [unclassified Streptomyces]NEA59553.1 DUF2716 domain-containing protein [Streptomyces sp. SID13666]NEA72721.1 DUF2716 domain-containing protein [Streptomyces sp. SID13588]
MSNAYLRELTDPERGAAWTAVDAVLRFNIQQRPAIAEPIPSATWSLDALDTPDGYPIDDLTDALYDVMSDALLACTPADGELLLLDWQHSCRRVLPHQAPRTSWQDAFFPDGDWIFEVAPDVSYGSFGDPREGSLCLFGEQLLDLAAPRLNTLLGQPLRATPRPS